MSSGVGQHIRGNVVGYAALFVALSGTAWAAGQIGSDDIAKNAVRSTHIGKGQVRKADVKPGSISSAHLADNAVGTAELGDRTVTGVKIAEGAVDAQHLADGSVFSRHILDDAVGASEIQSDAIAGAEVQDETLGGADVQDGALRGEDIQDGALRGEDIQDATVTGADVLESSLGQVPHAASATNADRVNGIQVRTIRYRSNTTSSATTVLDDLHGLTLLAACPSGNVQVIAVSEANNATINSASTDVTNGEVDNQASEADFDAAETLPIVGASATEVDTQVGSTQYLRPEGFASRAVSVTWQSETVVPGFTCLFTGIAIGG